MLLAREIAQCGVKATTADLRVLMAELERKHPGDRENSLYASVELSLRRLRPESRQRIKVLGVCHGGVHFAILGHLAGLEEDAARQLGFELIEVGLGEDMGYGHLRLDPGLPPYLLGLLTAEEADAARARWAEAMFQLTRFLYQQETRDAQLAAQLTLLELPNLLAMLEGLNSQCPSERMVDLAQGVERLVANLGRPKALAVVTRVREQAAQKLGEWSSARFMNEAANFDRFFERHNLSAAHEVAQQLLKKCRAAGEAAYPGAAYDLATAYFLLGRVLYKDGAAEAALGSLAEAQRCFQQLADGGNAAAERMASVCIVDAGNCLLALGRLDDAAAAFEKGVKCVSKFDDRKGVATCKFQLGSVRILQKRYTEAIEIYAEALDTFATLGEQRMVAASWHHIGMVHQEAGQIEPAEQAYRQSLAISVREDDLAEQASTLNQLGNLNREMGRLEEAVTFCRQAAEVRVRLKDLAGEGRSRNNLAYTLIKLKCYDEARQELLRAIECGKAYGHASQPWKTWSSLENLERATNHAEAASAARQQAVHTYLAYRRAGGVSQSNRAHWFERVAQAIRQKQAREAHEELAQLASRPNWQPFVKALLAKLQLLLVGRRNPDLAADPELKFYDAAELQLLLESLPPR